MLVWALVLSVGLHLLAVLLIPNIRWEELQEPEVLVVELMQPEPEPAPAPTTAEPEPEPLPEPEPPPPPPKKETPKPRPEPKPEPTPIPEPMTEPPPPESKPEATAPPAVITAPPVEEPTLTAPPPPPEPTGPTQADLDAARSLYKSLLEKEIIRHKTYPRIATMRGWQGEAIIELQLDANGKPSSVKVQTSSGYEVLDQTAIEMVRKTVAATQLPDILRGSISTFLVPVSFRLQN